MTVTWYSQERKITEPFRGFELAPTWATHATMQWNKEQVGFEFFRTHPQSDCGFVSLWISANLVTGIA